MVQPGDTLLAIADRFADETVDPETIKAENGLQNDAIELFRMLDVCVDNGINDITGEARGERNAVIVHREVIAQQTKLNELFAGYGIRELLVDGVSGPVTRQRLCAFRLAAGLPVSATDMVAGSEEEQILMATPALPIPFTSAILAERWVLIDRTCQIMFVGEGTQRLTFVFPTSTGMPGFETRDQLRSRAFKFNPALGNGGWHDSLTYRPPRTTRSTATCTSRSTSTAARRSTVPTTCRQRLRAKAAHGSVSSTWTCSSPGSGLPTPEGPCTTVTGSTSPSTSRAAGSRADPEHANR